MTEDTADRLMSVKEKDTSFDAPVPVKYLRAGRSTSG
jgi:hypothetical protein